MKYVEGRFSVTPPDGTEILMALLAEAGFESFEENEKGCVGYIKKIYFNLIKIKNVLDAPELKAFKITFKHAEVPEQNWNEEWEKNFPPVVVANQIYVRAPFHPSNPQYPFEILIEPKMAFGTAHHETTQLMMELILETRDFSKQYVLDMGCGTAILGILAKKLNAFSIFAIDNDHWATTNASETVVLNKLNHIQILEGDVNMLKLKSMPMFDTILANINRNILLEDIPIYVQKLKNEGYLYLSGFYFEDLEKINHCCEQNQLKQIKYLDRNNWIAVKYQLVK